MVRVNTGRISLVYNNARLVGNYPLQYAIIHLVKGFWDWSTFHRYKGGSKIPLAESPCSYSWPIVEQKRERRRRLRWQKVVTQLSNPFVAPSLSFAADLEAAVWTSKASDNDNVAFGIPTDLETTSRSSEARKAGEREERRNGVFVVFVVRVVGDKHYYRGFRGGSLKCSLAEMGEDHDLRS